MQKLTQNQFRSRPTRFDMVDQSKHISLSWKQRKTICFENWMEQSNKSSSQHTTRNSPEDNYHNILTGFADSNRQSSAYLWTILPFIVDGHSRKLVFFFSHFKATQHVRIENDPRSGNHVRSAAAPPRRRNHGVQIEELKHHNHAPGSRCEWIRLNWIHAAVPTRWTCEMAAKRAWQSGGVEICGVLVWDASSMLIYSPKKST